MAGSWDVYMSSCDGHCETVFQSGCALSSFQQRRKVPYDPFSIVLARGRFHVAAAQGFLSEMVPSFPSPQPNPHLTAFKYSQPSGWTATA